VVGVTAAVRQHRQVGSEGILRMGTCWPRRPACPLQRRLKIACRPIRRQTCAPPSGSPCPYLPDRLTALHREAKRGSDQSEGQRSFPTPPAEFRRLQSSLSAMGDAGTCPRSWLRFEGRSANQQTTWLLSGSLNAYPNDHQDGSDCILRQAFGAAFSPSQSGAEREAALANRRDRTTPWQ